jgi:hypothetical protein
MIKQLLLLFNIFLATSIYAQDTIYSIAYSPTAYRNFYFEDRDTANYFHFNTGNNIWQIGTPSKTVFNSAYSPALALVTDTLNPYPINNQSSFEVVIRTDDYTEISFWHRFDSDSHADGGVIEVSTDGGANWANALASPLFYSLNNFYSSSDTIASNSNKPGFTGNSNWIQSTMVAYGLYFVRFKFTFTSDNVNTTKDGWMIDDFSVTCLGTGINEVQTSSPFHISPNPTSNIIHIRSDYAKTFKTAVVTDISGRTILTTEKSTIDLTNLDSGVYIIEIRTAEENYMTRIVRE